MDVMKLEERYDELLERFVGMEPGTEEYAETEMALDGLQRKILSLKEYEDKREDLELKRSFEANKLEKELSLQKSEGWKQRLVDVGKTLLGIAAGLGLTLLTGDLQEITILDKNRFNIASRFFPRP